MPLKRSPAGTALACLAASLAWLGSAALGQSTGNGPDLHGREIQSLSPTERALWQSGHWIHDWHEGHLAWWWLVGGSWYFYQLPRYPYPLAIAPAIVAENAPPVPAGVPPAEAWFYCDHPAGYSPYISSCDGPWRQVGGPRSTVAKK